MEKSVDDFYRYNDTRLYGKCKKCHNKTRNKYERKRNNTDRAPSTPLGGSTSSVIVMQTPSGEMKYFAFDFIAAACRALSPTHSYSEVRNRNSGSTTSRVQTNVTPSNPEEVKVGSS